MSFYLVVPLILIINGLIGIFLGKKNLILILISIELILLGIILHYILIGWCNFGDLKIIVLSVLMLTIGASESALGLGLIIAYTKSCEIY